MTGKEFSTTMDEQGRFEKLARAVWPLMEQIGNLVREHGFEKTGEITINKDGYSRFTTYDTDWELVKYSKDDKPKLHLDYSRSINLEV